jgi:ABC-2 type transport system ATP-binding protein
MIEVKRLTKEFKLPQKNNNKNIFLNYLFPEYYSKKVVDDISFKIAEGEIVGYLGPNGAGKSTTIKMLTGILTPTQGELIVGGLNPFGNRKEFSKIVGAVFGHRTQLWWDLPVIDSFELLRRMYKITERDYKKNMEMFEDLLHIGEFIDIPTRKLSLGQRMRADFAAALIHRPKIIFLDEPTIGLDIVAKDNIRDFIATINQENKVTVVLTTHDIGDIERLCNRTIVIDQGKIVYDGDIDTMKACFGDQSTIVIDIKEEYPFVFPIQVEVYKRQGRRIWLKYYKREISAAEILIYLLKQHEIADISIEEPNIGTIIKKMYAGDTFQKEIAL